MKVTSAVAALALAGVTAAAAAAASPPPLSSSLRGSDPGRALQNVGQQLCYEKVSGVPNEYQTVACDFAFYENCGGPYTCTGSEGAATVGGEGGCGSGKFTILQLENSPSCPWEYQCC